MNTQETIAMATAQPRAGGSLLVFEMSAISDSNKRIATAVNIPRMKENAVL